MPILGLRHTANFVTNERPENWRQGLLMLYPNSAEAAKAPLTALTSLMKEASTDDPVYHWWEKALDDRRLKLSASITNVVTAIPVDSAFKTAFIVKAGDLLLAEATGEIMRVSVDPTVATGITVTRAFAGTTGLALDPALDATNPYLTVIGSAFEEGSLAPTGVNYDPSEKFNYTQIFRSTLEITRTAAKTRLRTTEAVKEAKRECLEYIGVDMERAFWFGQRSSGTLNGKPVRTSAGVVAQITAGAPGNIYAAPAGGLISMDWLEINMEKAFRFGSSEKMAFGSNFALLAVQQAIRKNSTWNIQNGMKEYGMAVTRITSPFGELVLKVHPLFNQMQGGVHALGSPFNSIANNLYILDMSNIRYRYLTESDLHYQADLEPNGLDGMKSGYIGECGIELNHALSHNIFTGLRGGTTDA